ncbi:Qat anti-phage system TatD family nuclease QatD [Azospirillum argentinense]|uniref:TatD DNase family protein n=1 Tax=Azospirillum argentinense TaxID=2970906 RepID=A0A5B0KMV3_9PROT|nr:Qat anti-phage system TatD family nuclease QatD [Azospirillum argentinense]KAA1053136.1 Putative deoxyribonuclease similar to YcfH, type 4 [Azospirillum argentinense]
MSTPTVDLHCHLDLYPDPIGAARRCAESGAYILSVTTTPKAWRGTAALAKGHDRIRTALGLHPQLAHERIGELPLFEALLPETRYVGEVGLDGSPECKPYWREQVSVFDHVLAASARAGGRILSIHSRRAATEVLDVLARHPDAGIPVLHWFSGTKAELQRAVAMGCWFSVGPAMVTGKRGRDLLAAMPRDRVLTETDGPFAAIGGKPLSPGEVAPACEALGACWDISADEAATAVLGNLRRLASSAVGGPASPT